MADFDASILWLFTDPPNDDPPVQAEGPNVEASLLFAPATDSAEFLMVAQDQGRPSGSNYSVWVAAGEPDYAGAGYASADPVPSGAIVAGSVRVLGRSTSR